MSENRYEGGPAYLPATRPDVQPGLVELQRIAGPGHEPLDVLRSAIPAYDAASERTTAKDRALATTLRIVLWVVTVLLGAGLLYVVGVDAGWVVVAVVVLLLVGYRLLTRLDYEYSAPGVARYAIDAAERLAAEQQARNHELRQQALAAYLVRLEQHHDD